MVKSKFHFEFLNIVNNQFIFMVFNLLKFLNLKAFIAFDERFAVLSFGAQGVDPRSDLMLWGFGTKT